MALIINRVDDRLIHGQVATSWIRSQSIQVIVVVDDLIAQDAMQLSILKVSAPAETKVYTMSQEKFIKKYNAGILDDYRVMLVFANVYAPLALIEGGIPIKSINLGGLRFKEGRRQISKALSLNEAEEAVVRKLVEMGIEVEHRQLQSDPKIDVLKLL